MPKTVFISYSHRDARWLERLRVHLAPFVRGGVLQLWDDTTIVPGRRWKAEITKAVEGAAASVVLVSPDFLASDFVAVHELPHLLRMAEESGRRILPIVVEPCELAPHPELAALQALNAPTKPLARLRRPAAEQMLASIAARIGALLADDGRPVAVAKTRRITTTPESALYEEMLQGSIALTVLWALTASPTPLSLSEVVAQFGITSRRRAFDAMRRMELEGWVERERIDRQVRFSATTLGSRQLERLAAACDGPVRRVTTRV